MADQLRAIDQKVGARVRIRRVRLGISQRGLARKIGVTFQQVQNYENGANRISAGRLQTISMALNTPISFFFNDGASEDGRETDQDISDVFAFAGSPDGSALIRALYKIKDENCRQKILALLEELVQK